MRIPRSAVLVPQDFFFFFVKLLIIPKSNTLTRWEKSVIRLLFRSASCSALRCGLCFARGTTKRFPLLFRDNSVCCSPLCLLKKVLPNISYISHSPECILLWSCSSQYNDINDGITWRNVAHEPDEWQPKGWLHGPRWMYEDFATSALFYLCDLYIKMITISDFFLHMVHTQLQQSQDSNTAKASTVFFPPFFSAY